MSTIDPVADYRLNERFFQGNRTPGRPQQAVVCRYADGREVRLEHQHEDRQVDGLSVVEDRYVQSDSADPHHLTIYTRDAWKGGRETFSETRVADGIRTTVTSDGRRTVTNAQGQTVWSGPLEGAYRRPGHAADMGANAGERLGRNAAPTLRAAGFRDRAQYETARANAHRALGQERRERSDLDAVDGQAEASTRGDLGALPPVYQRALQVEASEAARAHLRGQLPGSTRAQAEVGVLGEGLSEQATAGLRQASRDGWFNLATLGVPATMVAAGDRFAEGDDVAATATLATLPLAAAVARFPAGRVVLVGLATTQAVDEARQGDYSNAAASLTGAALLRPWARTSMPVSPREVIRGSAPYPSERCVVGTAPQSERVPQSLVHEMEAAGVKFDRDALVAVRRGHDGRPVFLERGTPQAGLQHIEERHGADFERVGIPRDEIPDAVMNALSTGRPVGTSGRNRPVYILTSDGRTRHIAVQVGSNGYVVGANPVSRFKPISGEGPDR